MVSISKVIVFSRTNDTTNVIGLDTKLLILNTKNREKQNMVDTWYKVEKHKENIIKTSNISLTELQTSQKRKFVSYKLIV